MQKQTEIFTNKGLDNIFNGAILTNEHGQKQVIGYRLENLHSETCPIYARSYKDKNGVYSGNGFIFGIQRRNKKNKALFFPSDWTREKVIKAISEAYGTQEVKSGQNFILGTSESGLKIRLWLDENGKVFDAMPLRTNEFGEVETRPKKKRGCKICGQPRHTVCFNHGNFSKPKISELIWKRFRYFSRKLYFNFARKLGFSV